MQLMREVAFVQLLVALQLVLVIRHGKLLDRFVLLTHGKIPFELATGVIVPK